MWSHARPINSNRTPQHLTPRHVVDQHVESFSSCSRNKSRTRRARTCCQVTRSGRASVVEVPFEAVLWLEDHVLGVFSARHAKVSYGGDRDAGSEVGTRQCPFCKEEVKATAVRCKHCLAAIQPTSPDHEGVCPFCKEEIDVEAIRCRHCKADLASSARRLRRVPRRQMSAPTAFVSRGVRPRGVRSRQNLRPRSADEGCPDFDTDDEGTWCFLESSEHYCIYELCEPAPVSPYTIFE